MTTTPADPTTADEAGFFAAVRACPEDDLRRLAYADWLDEHAGSVPCRHCEGDGRHRHDTVLGGGKHIMTKTAVKCSRCSGSGTVPDGRAARAEFIRVQVELARTAAPDGLHYWRGQLDQPRQVVEYLRLRTRELELFATHSLEWFGVDRPGGFAAALEPLVVDLAPTLPGVVRLAPTLLGVVRRGFVAEVRCPLAAWVGGPCGRCGGTGQRLTYESQLDGRCPSCLGTGRTPGCAGTVVAACPGLEAVRLTDREPTQLEGSYNQWAWRKASWQTYPSSLPGDLHRVLCDTAGTFLFPSPVAAHAALARAALAFGRHAAGGG